jgi:hypothetical protein
MEGEITLSFDIDKNFPMDALGFARLSKYVYFNRSRITSIAFR